MANEHEARNLPIWMLKAIGKPENARGRLLVLLDDFEDQKKALEVVHNALKEANIPASIRENF